jgi:hypothetical protein
MNTVQKHKRKWKRYRYKYIIKPKIEEIEKIKNSLIGFKLKDIKIKFGVKLNYFDLNDEISFLTMYKRSKEDIICSARFIKDEGNYYTVKEEFIDFDLIEEVLENKS